MIDGNAITILMVEDDPGDAELTRDCLRESRLRLNLRVVDDGEKALKYLRRESPYGEACEPDLILLDLNLPRVNGREVLAAIKQDQAIRHIPVVVLTTSESEADIADCYLLGANCYLSKPIRYEAFRDMIKRFEQFWFQVVKLPRKGGSNG